MTLAILSFIILVFSIIVHEIAHGWVAYLLGDPTAKYEDRLSLNPLNHIDPMGSILFPLLLLVLTKGRGPIFGWAKPVPINPYNFKDQRWGSMKVALAGPLANILIALVSGLIIRFFGISISTSFLVVLRVVTITNLSLGVFNLMPIPPLDGSHILLSFFPEKAQELKIFFQKYSLILLIIFIYFGADLIMRPIVNFLFLLFTGSY